MEPEIALVVIIVLVLPTALALWLIVRAVSATNRIEELSRRLGGLESEIFRLRQERERQATKSPEPPPAPKPEVVVAHQPPARHIVKPITGLPPDMVKPTPTGPSPIFVAPAPTPVFDPPRQPLPQINWEQFMGVKGFAWIGGLALFLGVAFFVKYSFDNNLVPPELRVAIGFLTGLGLLVGGVVMSRKNFTALSQTLCATGVVILYAVTFACRSIYHFDFFGPVPTFLLMALITTTAFFTAVRLNALVVAILGMLGGFLTPILLSTGKDNPTGLFGYIAILDAGLIIVALHRRWHFLIALAALGTAILQIGWADKFFVTEKYFEGNKILIALGVLLGFNALWLAANWRAKCRQLVNPWLSGSTLGLVAVALGFAGWFLDFKPLVEQPWLMFGFVFAIDLVAIAVTLLDQKTSAAQSISGLAVFGLLAFWTSESLSNERLNAALAFYFIFAVFHSALPALIQRRHGITTRSWVTHIFPILALALVLVPVFKLTEVSFVVWPFILLVDLLAIALAVLTATLLPVLAVLLLTLAATGALIFKIPFDLTGLPASFFMLGHSWFSSSSPASGS